MGATQQTFVYSQPLSLPPEPGFSPIYRNANQVEQLEETPHPEISSYRDIIIKSCLHMFKDSDLLGKITVSTVERENEEKEDTRELIRYKHEEIFKLSENLGTFLLQNGFQFIEKERGMKLIGVCTKNRYECFIADFACSLYGLTVVPIYENFGQSSISFCLNHSFITTCFCSSESAEIFSKLDNIGNIKNIISFDALKPEVEEKLKKLSIKVYYFSECIKPRKLIDYLKIPIKKDDILTFTYTSGTTGEPKAALLSHGNFLAIVASNTKSKQKGFQEGDIYLSFLPLVHIFEKAVVAAALYSGTFIAVFNGDVNKLFDDFAFVKPQIMVGVPRIYNKIVEKVKESFSQATGVAKCLINNGVSTKLENLRQNGTYTHLFYDAVVFSKIRSKFGGRVRVMLSGGAPISQQTQEYMKILMSCPLIEGYGQTESTAGGFVASSKDIITGHVGGPAICVQFKLKDIPEMQYLTTDKDKEGRPTPRGQIWLRGPSIFKGYYKDKEKTREMLTEDGWLMSGDVVMLMPNSNAIKIIDRKKNIFKLQQGQYVPAEKVEFVYCHCSFISEIFLTGQSDQNFPVAVIVVKQDFIRELAQKNNIKKPYGQICKQKLIRTLICKEMNGIGKKHELLGYQQCKNIFIEEKSFMERGILTGSMKLRRFEARKVYAKQIKDMYSEGSLL